MKKIVKVSAVITTAVVLTGCSGGSGGNSASNDNYYDNPTNPIIPGIDPIDPTKPEQSGYPAYYLNEELGGQKFVADGADWSLNNVDGNKEFNNANTNAQKFINAKVAELKQEMANQSYTPLGDKINTALNQYTNNDVMGNYRALAPIFVNLENGLNEQEHYRFYASYHKLAANAYNNSLGDYKNSPSLPANREMKNLPENLFVYELSLANLSYDGLTVDKAKEIMNDTLTMVGDQAGTGSLVLKKVVELALYNESLYGLHDFAGDITYVIDKTLENRTLTTFSAAIMEERDKTVTQNLDDRTM